MPRRKREASPVFDEYKDDFDDEVMSNGSRNSHPPQQRNAANARERARMQVLSRAFGRLKTKLPCVPVDTKLSKLDTLRLATNYIRWLGALLAGDPIDESQSPQCLLWPFSFQQQLDFRNNQFPTTDGSFGLDEWPIKHLGDHHEEKSTEFHNQWK